MNALKHLQRMSLFFCGLLLCSAFICLLLSQMVFAATDDGIALDKAPYAKRQTLPDFTADACPDNPRGLTQIQGNLYRHTTGAGLAVHSGLVLITKEGALVIDPAMTCTAGWLRDEIKTRFNVPVKYVVLTHAHTDHISGAQILQRSGATVVANQRAVEPIVKFKFLSGNTAMAGCNRHEKRPENTLAFRIWWTEGPSKNALKTLIVNDLSF